MKENICHELKLIMYQYLNLVSIYNNKEFTLIIKYEIETPILE